MAHESILIVEDEVIVAMEIESRLRKLGYRIAGSVRTGEDAIETARRERPDVLLMDIMLAGAMDGIEAAERITGDLGIPVVYLTAYADDEILRRAKLTEPFGYLVKPFEERELHTALEIALYKNRIERRLRESELRYRSLFAQAADAIFVLEAEGEDPGRIVEANRAAAEMHGSTLQELVGLNIRDLDAPADAADSAELLRRIRGGEWVKREIQHRRKDGTIFPVEISASLLTLAEKKYVLAIDRDITERKNAEIDVRLALVQAQEEKLKTEAIIAAMGDGISIQALDFTVLYQNDVHRGLIGEHVGERCYKAYERKDDVCEGCPVAKSFLDGQIHHEERTGMTDSGEVHVEITSSPVRDGEGRIVAGIEIARDITARKRAEAEREVLIEDLQRAMRSVSHSEQEWRLTFDSITDMISIQDAALTVIKVNRAFADYFRRDFGDVINRTCHELFNIKEEHGMHCPQEISLRENRPATTEFRDPRTDRLFLASTFPFQFVDTQERGVVHVMRDITEEREKEMRLIMSERLASLGQMASGIAHEINNPLAAISGCTEGLLRRVREGKFDPEYFLSYLTIIEEEIARCKGITTGMLSFVRQATCETKAVRLNELLARTIEIVGIQGRLKEVEIVKRFSADLPDIIGSEGELRQVFLTIIGNALDAMGERGALSLETSSDRQSVFVRIGDTGAGIRPENLDKIYEPFFTTKADQGGTGLGLSIGRKIVMIHNGRIDVVSEPGQGTTFTVQLPLSPSTT